MEDFFFFFWISIMKNLHTENTIYFLRDINANFFGTALNYHIEHYKHFFYGEFIYLQYFYSNFTTNFMWLVVIGYNLNLVLK